MEINYGLQNVVFQSIYHSYHLLWWVNFVEGLTAVCGEEILKEDRS